MVAVTRINRREEVEVEVARVAKKRLLTHQHVLPNIAMKSVKISV